MNITSLRADQVHIILARHGQTDLNTVKVKRGDFEDEPLNTVGKEQAKMLGARLQRSHGNISAVYSSNQTRAVQTAIGITQSVQTKNWVIDERLAEVKLGLTETMSSEQANETFKEFKEQMKKVSDPAEKRRYPGGETEGQVVARVRGVFEEVILPNSLGQTVMVISHGHTIRLAIKEFCPQQKIKKNLKNCEFIELLYDKPTHSFTALGQQKAQL